MRLKWTQKATRDLEAVKANLRGDDSGAANDTVLELIQQAGALAEHPGMGRPGRVKGTRELAVAGHPYVVEYIHLNDTVVVLRVLYRDERAEAW